MKLVELTLILLFCAPFTLFASGGDTDDEPDWIHQTAVESKERGKGEYYARVRQRDDLHGLDLFDMEVKIVPGGDFPTIKTKAYEWEQNIHVRIRLRGVDVPTDCKTRESRDRPHKEVEREEARYADGIVYLWSLIRPEVSETLIITNVEVDPQTYRLPSGEKVRGFIADIYTRIGQEDRDIALLLKADGFAVDDNIAVNWGLRRP